MSWENNIKNIRFSITTGDGKIYFPFWKTGEKSKEFNTTVFDFIDVRGSLVERKKPKSSKYPFTFWFQGEDNIEQSEEFERSAEDNRLWIITHPFYGTIKGQPVSIARNDQSFNITEITVDFWESIEADYPVSNFSVKDNTYEKKQSVLAVSAISYSAKGDFKTTDIIKNKESANITASNFKDLQNNETNADYQNAISAALKANDNLLIDPLNAIQKTQQLLDLPSSYEVPVFSRLKSFLNAYNQLKKPVQSVEDKLFFETQAGSCIASYCNASINPLEGEYKRVPEVEKVSSDLLSMYEDYLTILDGYSVSNYDIENTYHPDSLVQKELNSLVMFTIGNIYELAFDAQRERVVYTDKETNLIILTHRYLGLDASDENIQEFRIINGITLRELFSIKKDRKIIYYV